MGKIIVILLLLLVGCSTTGQSARPTAVNISNGESVNTKTQIEQMLVGTTWVQDVVVNDSIQRVQLVFTAGQTEETMHGQMTALFCLIKPAIPQDYSLRLAGEMANSLGAVSAVVGAEKIQAATCPGTIDWMAWADEYSGPSGTVQNAVVTLPAVMAVAEEMYVADGNLNVRSCASTDCESLGMVNGGTRLAVTGMTDGEEVNRGNKIWYRVLYGGGEGYVYSELMSRYVTPAPQPTAVPQQQQQVNTQPQQPAAQIPDNCDEAVAMGLTAEQAGQYDHLDRDNDGVACYGD